MDLYRNLTEAVFELVSHDNSTTRIQSPITSFNALTLKVPLSCWHISVQAHPVPQLYHTGLLEKQ